ncbi:methyl-accepting chemotaxis protein [Pseudomonas arsenicoxydans]|uniref:Methyl-accepting chemotaxis protein n=1 Tax=Pseudomonas arsenicoxydans TaxID=702115 RepID=A0A1H0P4K8_9PSED|nr:methyl-accepting chemotaxis protein [Pseudomonas arsenicoxydans]SDO99615.1 methyl-accepting chemotaxis protein [Pseudomonas arsenicoxydans]
MKTRNITIATRATLSFGIICLLLIILSITVSYKLNDLHTSASELQHDWLPSVKQAGKIEIAAMRCRLDARRFVMDNDRQSEASISEMNAMRKDLAEATKSYAPYVSSPKEKEIYDRVVANVAAFQAKNDELLPLSKTSSEEALALFIRDNSKPPAVVLQSSIEELIALNELGADHSGLVADEGFKSGMTITIVLSVMALFVTLLVALVFTRSITVPVLSLLGVTRKIADGDLRTQVVVTGADEITALQHATSAMLSNLKSTIQHISDSSGQLASAAEEMSSITKESNEGIQRQTMETEQAATAVNEMTAAVEEVARNAVSASQSTQASEYSAQTGKERVGQAITSLEKLSSTVGRTGVEVKGLANQAQNIASVLDVIHSIADQTNLLALNAAIEAARAGEQGRGFAVVADEVRALAHRTQASTHQIAQMIEDIQKGSSMAVQSMKQSSEEAESTLLIAHEAGIALQQITVAISDINERNLMIATASEEQAQVARSVDENLVSIRDLSIQSSAAAHQTSEASHELSKLAIDLNKLVARFSI